MSFKRMTHSELLAKIKEIFAACVAEAEKKNADYASHGIEGTSGLNNFYATAAKYNMTPMQAWAVHDYKHDIAITQLVNGLQLRSETVRNRFIDRANYAILGLLLYEEMEAERLANEAGKNPTT